MCGWNSSTAARITPSSLPRPSGRTSCPSWRSVETTWYSVFHSAAVTWSAAAESGGTRLSCMSASTRRLREVPLVGVFLRAILERESMTSAVQVVHHLRGEQRGELQLRLVGRQGEAQLQ